jgi:hypothetical protein
MTLWETDQMFWEDDQDFREVNPGDQLKPAEHFCELVAELRGRKLAIECRV